MTYKGENLDAIKDIYLQNYSDENVGFFRKEIKSLDYSNIFKKLFLDNNFEWCDEKEEYLELSVWRSEYSSPLYNDQLIHQDLIKKGKDVIHLNTCIVYLEQTFKVGGNLIFYDNFKKIDKIIKVEKDLICIFDGDIYHRPQNTKGNGIRVCIIFQKGK